MAVAALLLASCGAGEGRVPAPDTGAAEEVAPPAPPFRITGEGWYREVVFYHLWVRSFRDSDGDGVGDLRGVVEKLDHLEALGVEALWLSPFYPTPYADSGYDVADHVGVDPGYGTLADWDLLLAEAHARGIRVVNDLILNHTSVAHPWFQASRSGTADPRRAWYLWAPAPAFDCPPIDEEVFGAEPWSLDELSGEYYFHRFYAEQPDLNYRTPAVAEAMRGVARFWLDRGADGFRLDAVTSLVEDLPDTPPEAFRCDHHPDTHAFLRSLRETVDTYPDRVLVAEAWGDPAETAAFFGDGTDEVHMSFSQTLAVALRATFLFDNPGALADALAQASAPLPPGAHWGLFLSNHDQPRIMAAVGNDPVRAALAAVLLLTLPGTPFVYYGDEVGLTDGEAVVVDARDRSRTPMPWNDGPGLGFTEGTPWLAPAAGWETANVTAQEGDPSSLLELYRALLMLRRETEVFGTGAFQVLDLPAIPDRVLVFRRGSAARGALVLTVFGAEPLEGDLDLAPLAEGRPATAVLASFPAPDLETDGVLPGPLPAPAFALWTW